MINIAICDDEEVILNSVKKQVVDFFHTKNMEIRVFLYKSGEELLNSKKEFDILFLDIQMKEIDGMETARKMRDRNFKGILIFITVLKEMVFQSFEVQAFAYLLKPIQQAEFVKTMERVLSSIKQAGEAKLLIQKGMESRIISFEDIVFCEVIDRKVYLHLKTGDTIDYYDKMENLETKFDDRFFRCHRSYFINMQYLTGYKNGTAFMEGNHEIPVSRLRSREFSNVILQYMKKWR